MTSLISTKIVEAFNRADLLMAMNSGSEFGRYLELKKDLLKDDFREDLLP